MAHVDDSNDRSGTASGPRLIKGAPHNRWGTDADADDWIPQPKILLEGTHLNRKTDIAFALAEHVDVVGNRRHRWHVPLLSAEWQTRSDGQPTKANPGRSMIDFLDRDDDWAHEAFETYVRLLELHRDYYWVIDRFHISAIAFQRMAYGREVDLSWVDRRLAALGVVLVHCRRDPASFETARELRLTYSDNPHNYDDLSVFAREQQLIQEIIDDSAMVSINVDVTDGDIDRMASDILNAVRGLDLWYRPERNGAVHR